MGETDLSSSNVGSDIIRRLLSTLDRPAYWLLGLCYELFFNVASADLFSNQTVMKFYGRVQVILGVFMMFQLSMTILKGIVNPDSFTGDKGAKAVITRIITSLILLTLLMPISIPSPKNEYEIQINNNGLLFGTIYSLQHRILSNNTIGRLVLGTTDNDEGFKATSSTDDDNNLKKSARIFTSTIIKGFYRINLIPEEERDDTYLKEGKDPATYNENRVCTDIPDDVLDRYTRIDADPGDIIDQVNETCTVDFNVMNYIPFVNAFAGSKKYVFTYMPIISMIVALIFVFVLLSFTVDVAVRAVKLAVLRLIAPIPIISYMDPNGGKDGAFNSWVKALTSTYLDLFIRLAVVYFVIFLIQDMIVHGVVMDAGNDIILSVISMIIIWIGLFIFAKQAPKFIKQVLGIKEDGGKLFSGFGELAGIAGTASSIGAGAVTGWRGSRASQEANWNAREHAPGETFHVNRGRQVASSIFGGAMSGFTAGKAAAGAKDHQGRAALAAASKRNNSYAAAAEDGATFRGKVGAYFQRAFTGETSADSLERQQKSYENRSKVAAAIANRGDEKAKTTKWTTGTSSWTDSSGVTHTVSGNYQAWTNAKKAAEDSGATSFSFNGSTYTLEEANNLDYGLMTTNSAHYIRQRGVDPVSRARDVTLDEYIRDFEASNGQGSFAQHTSGTTGAAARKYFKDESEAQASKASDAKRKLGVAKANADSSKPS